MTCRGTSSLEAEGQKISLYFGEVAFLLALFHLPSLDVWRVRSVCGEWRKASSQRCAFTLWRHFGMEHPLGLVAEGAVWLHTVATFSKVVEALRLLQRCVLIEASWLCPLGVERLLFAVEQIDRPWNLVAGSSGGRNIIKPWRLGLPSDGSQPASALCDFLQLGDLLASNGRCLGHIHSKPLRVVTADISFFVHLTLSFRHGGECMLRWTGSCSKDMFENDIEVELSGRLISPCQVDISPFGICDQKVSDFVVDDDDRYNQILEALSCRQDFICILQITLRHLGAEYKAFNVSTVDGDTVLML